MGKREKIIVIFAGLAVVYFIFDLLFFSGKKAVSTISGNTEDLNNFVSELSGKIGAETFSKSDMYVLKMAITTWNKNPFIKSLPSVIKEERTDETDKKQELIFIYSGYIQAGNDIIAIINGMEYQENDILRETSYIVKSISPNIVIIDTGQKQIFLPFEEE
ncbi:MAG: hypothetical protein HQK76_00820 [Desulfobacterales bacterium]|nr:hypothetical protein [Desulfobacterales bacterium]